MHALVFPPLFCSFVHVFVSFLLLFSIPPILTSPTHFHAELLRNHIRASEYDRAGGGMMGLQTSVGWGFSDLLEQSTSLLGNQEEER